MAEHEDAKPFTVKKLAERWDCTEETIYALIRKFVKGEPDGLPAFTIGGKLWRIKAEIVEQWESSGGSMKWAASDSARSSAQKSDGTKPSSAGVTRAESHIDTDLVSSLKRRAELRSMHGLAGSKL